MLIIYFLGARLGSLELRLLFRGHFADGFRCFARDALGRSASWITLALVLLPGSTALLASLDIPPVLHEPTSKTSITFCHASSPFLRTPFCTYHLASGTRAQARR